MIKSFRHKGLEKFYTTGSKGDIHAKQVTGISVDMALRLSQWLGTTPEVWLRMQDACDLWQAQKSKRPKIKPLQSRETDHSASN